jgi:hypothetical protein
LILPERSNPYSHPGKAGGLLILIKILPTPPNHYLGGMPVKVIRHEGKNMAPHSAASMTSRNTPGPNRDTTSSSVRAFRKPFRVFFGGSMYWNGLCHL